MTESRSFTVHRTSLDGAFASRYPALARTPFILDATPRFHRLGNAYLVDKALGLWTAQTNAKRATSLIPTPRSLQNYAERLCNFLEWSTVRGINLSECSYAIHVSGQYQTEMLNGIWSRDGHRLTPKTVNLRVQQACDFLLWMADTGRRSEFEVPYSTIALTQGSATYSVGHVPFSVRARKNRVRQQNRALNMPSDECVSSWLSDIYRTGGNTIGLMCETVLLTAMRREEVVCLPVTVLHDDPDEWQIVNPQAPEKDQQVRVVISDGTKGPCYGFNERGDKIGPTREILVPLELARKWHAYKRHDRNKAFAAALRDKKGHERAARAKRRSYLFLQQTTGDKFTGPSFYYRWTVDGARLKGWTPHAGRHWWACSMLWRELKNFELAQPATNEAFAAMLDNVALGIIRLQIQPQLGHASDTTTMLYLRWIREVLGVPLSIPSPSIQPFGDLTP